MHVWIFQGEGGGLDPPTPLLDPLMQHTVILQSQILYNGLFFGINSKSKFQTIMENFQFTETSQSWHFLDMLSLILFWPEVSAVSVHTSTRYISSMHSQKFKFHMKESKTGIWWNWNNCYITQSTVLNIEHTAVCTFNNYFL